MAKENDDFEDFIKQQQEEEDELNDFVEEETRRQEEIRKQAEMKKQRQQEEDDELNDFAEEEIRRQQEEEEEGKFKQVSVQEALRRQQEEETKGIISKVDILKTQLEGLIQEEEEERRRQEEEDYYRQLLKYFDENHVTKPENFLESRIIGTFDTRLYYYVSNELERLNTQKKKFKLNSDDRAVYDYLQKVVKFLEGSINLLGPRIGDSFKLINNPKPTTNIRLLKETIIITIRELLGGVIIPGIEPSFPTVIQNADNKTITPPYHTFLNRKLLEIEAYLKMYDPSNSSTKHYFVDAYKVYNGLMSELIQIFNNLHYILIINIFIVKEVNKLVKRGGKISYKNKRQSNKKRRSYKNKRQPNKNKRQSNKNKRQSNKNKRQSNKNKRRSIRL